MHAIRGFYSCLISANASCMQIRDGSNSLNALVDTAGSCSPASRIELPAPNLTSASELSTLRRPARLTPRRPNRSSAVVHSDGAHSAVKSEFTRPANVQAHSAVKSEFTRPANVQVHSAG